MKRDPWIGAGIGLLFAVLAGAVLSGYFGPEPVSGPAVREHGGSVAEPASPRHLF